MGQTRIPQEQIPADMDPEVRACVLDFYSSDSAKRAEAAYRLRGLIPKGASAVPFLIGILGDDAEVKAPPWLKGVAAKSATTPGREAAEVLYFLRDAAEKPLVEALKDKDARVRINAAHAIPGMFSEDVIEPLFPLLEDPDPLVKCGGIVALGECLEYQRHVQEAKCSEGVRRLIPLLKDLSSNVRRDAAAALGKIRDKRTVDPLIAVLGDEKKWVRSAAAKSLGEIGDPKACEALVPVLNDPESAYVRRDAAIALAKLKDGRAIEPLLKALADEKLDGRDEVVVALTEFDDPQAVEAVLAAAKSENAKIREGAARALLKVDDPRVIDALLLLLKDRDREVRVSAVHVPWRLKREGHEEEVQKMIGPLSEAMKDDDYRVRLNAPHVLSDLADLLPKPTDERIVNALMLGVTGKDQSVRHNSTVSLVSVLAPPSRRPIPPELRTNLSPAWGKELVSVLLAGANDVDEHVRRYSCEALKFVKTDDPEIITMLKKAHDEGDEDLRESVAKALARSGNGPDGKDLGDPKPVLPGMSLDLGGGLAMDFVLMPAGEFTMGSDKEHFGPAHKVRITKPFYMGVTEVTQVQYRTVMKSNPSSLLKKGALTHVVIYY